MAGHDGFTIRVARSQDAAAVTSLLEESYSKLWASSYPRDLLEAALPLLTGANPVLLASGHFFVATDNETGQMTGCGGWSMTPPGGGKADPAVAHVRHFATHPDKTRRGIGRAILERCFKQAVAHGAERMSCQSSITAVAFYHHCGFVAVGPTQVLLPNGLSIDAVLMIRELNSRPGNSGT